MTEAVDNKKKNEWIYRAVVIGGIGFLISQMLPILADLENRTFDSAQDKILTKQHVDTQPPMTRSDKDQVMRHLEDTDRHMSRQEKEQLIIIRENQTRIGQDLAEIKALLKQRQ